MVGKSELILIVLVLSGIALNKASEASLCGQHMARTDQCKECCVGEKLSTNDENNNYFCVCTDKPYYHIGTDTVLKRVDNGQRCSKWGAKDANCEPCCAKKGFTPKKGNRHDKCNCDRSNPLTRKSTARRGHENNHEHHHEHHHGHHHEHELKRHSVQLLPTDRLH